MTSSRKLIAMICSLIVTGALLLGTAAFAAPETPLVSKDGTTYVLEDLNLYFLRNLGKDGLLDYLQNIVIYQDGLKQGLKPTDAERQKFISDTMGADVYAQFKQLYSPRAVDMLVDYTLVNSKYEDWLRDKIKREKNFTVSEQEARDYFLGHIEEFHLPEGAYLSIISVSNKTQADSVIQRLKSGEDFRKIAGEVNMDANMRAARGEIGVYRKGDGLPKPLEDAAMKLQEGKYSDIITGTNYHILFCHKRYAEIKPTFDDIKEQLMHDMLEAKIDPLYVEELNKLMQRELPRFNIQAELFRPVEEGAASGN